MSKIASTKHELTQSMLFYNTQFIPPFSPQRCRQNHTSYLSNYGNIWSFLFTGKNLKTCTCIFRKFPRSNIDYLRYDCFWCQKEGPTERKWLVKLTSVIQVSLPHSLALESRSWFMWLKRKYCETLSLRVLPTFAPSFCIQMLEVTAFECF